MILHGDCFDLIKDIKDKSIDLILIDPPYLISRESNFTNYSKDTSSDLANSSETISFFIVRITSLR